MNAPLGSFKSKEIITSGIFFGFWLLVQAVSAQPYGLDSRTTNTAHFFTAPPAGSSEYRFRPMFPEPAPFKRPQDIAIANDGSNRVFVANQNGIIYTFLNTDPPTTPTVFLPQQHSDSQFILEEGLEGIALHPDFATNGYIFTYYVYQRAPGVRTADVIRYQAIPPSASSVSTATATRIYRFDPINNSHMGGGLRFGPDGYLYFSYGDGLDFRLDATDLASPRGKILRIDIDHATSVTNYRIPPDNPFITTPGALPEIYAQGMRNPFRLNFDKVTGDLYVGDVGEGFYEEISKVTRGAHMGWPFYEGPLCYYFWWGDCSGIPQQPYTFPELYLEHDDPVYNVNSLTSGERYRGTRFPELYDTTFWGDFTTGKLGVYKYDDALSTLTRREVLIADGGIGITAIINDQQDEPIFTDWYGGNLHRLARAEVPAAGRLPNAFSEAPWLIEQARGLPVEGVYPYEINAPFWSDYAVKSRAIVLPHLDRITQVSANRFAFTTGTMLIKNFRLPLDRNNLTTGRLIATRLLLHLAAGWSGYTYEWNEDESDAFLVPAEGKTLEFTVTDLAGTTVTQTWSVPSRADCLACHTSAAGRVLGFTPQQLNRYHAFPQALDNQLRTFEHIGLFTAPLNPPLSAIEPQIDPYNQNYPLEERARSYLSVNCSMCHQPGGGTPVDMDLRFATPFGDMKILDEPVGNLPGELNEILNPYRLRAGHPEDSIIYRRMNAGITKPWRMPPASRNEIDPQGEQLLREWINSLANQVEAESWMQYH